MVGEDGRAQILTREPPPCRGTRRARWPRRGPQGSGPTARLVLPVSALELHGQSFSGSWGPELHLEKSLEGNGAGGSGTRPGTAVAVSDAARPPPSPPGVVSCPRLSTGAWQALWLWLLPVPDSREEARSPGLPSRLPLSLAAWAFALPWLREGAV